MNKSVLGFKCKNCGADLKYNPKLQMLVCDYCGSKYDEKEFNKNKEQESKEKKSVELDEYSCPSCGAIVITDKNTTATECVYCGSSAIVKNRLEGKFKPDKIITFKTVKQKAIESFEKYVNERWFVPDEFGNKDNIAKVNGVYIPFWLFDCKTQGELLAKAYNTRTYVSRGYRITETDIFDCARAGEMEFIDIPVDGSSKFPDDIMDSIEPFDYSEFKEFKYSYLSGFLSEKFDLTSDEVFERAKIRAENTTLDMLNVGFEYFGQVQTTHQNVLIDNSIDVEYALLPVWMLNIVYKGQMYTFAMNGQTGKMVGNVPIKKSKVVSYFLKLFSIVFIILFIIANILGLM